MSKIGESEAVNRFLSKYGNVRTKWIYAYWIQKYIEWLKERGIELGPDALVDDNLISIFKSDPTVFRFIVGGFLLIAIDASMIAYSFKQEERPLAERPPISTVCSNCHRLLPSPPPNFCPNSGARKV